MEPIKLSRREFGGTVTAAVSGVVLHMGAAEGAVAQTGCGRSFFEKCAFVCIDFQEGPREKTTSISIEWEKSGYTVADCQAAVDFCHDVGIPNARRVADACRSLRLPMIFVK